MAHTIDINFLTNISFLRDLTTNELDSFASILKQRKFKEGDTIVNEGEEGFTMYIFKEGQVQVVNHITLRIGSHDWSDAEKSIATLDASKMNFFGEMSLLTGAPRSATIKAVTPCILYEIHKDDFEELSKQQPEMGYKILWQIASVLCNRIKANNSDILKLTTALSIALSKKKR